MPLTITGQTGRVMVGYQVAAELGPWELIYGAKPDDTDAAPAGWTLKTTANDINQFWLARSTYDLRLTVGQRTWRWRGVAIDWPDCQCAFTITGEGRPEIS